MTISESSKGPVTSGLWIKRLNFRKNFQKSELHGAIRPKDYHAFGEILVLLAIGLLKVIAYPETASKGPQGLLPIFITQYLPNMASRTGKHPETYFFLHRP